jgi:VWFA-related protein
MTRRLTAVLLALALVPALAAQSFQESVRVDVVTVHLTAIGADGDPVTNLQKAELVLRIDGTLVEIDSFQSSRSHREASAATSFGAPAGTDPGWPAASRRLPAGAHPYRLVILIDVSSMSPLSQHDMYRQLTNSFEAGVPAGVSVRLERFDGRTLDAYPWSSDRGRLRQQLHEMSSRLTFNRVPGVNEREAMVRDALHSFANVEEYARKSLAALSNAVERLAELSGRKALLFLTDGGPLFGSLPRTADTLFCRLDPSEVTRARAATGYETQGLLDELVRRAARHDVMLVPVNSEALSAESIEWGSAMLADRAELNLSMVNLAKMTGGEAVLRGGYLSKRLPDFLRTSAEGYVLAFRDPFRGDGEYHRIEISTRRSTVALRHRAGYQALEPGKGLGSGNVTRQPSGD